MVLRNARIPAFAQTTCMFATPKASQERIMADRFRGLCTWSVSTRRSGWRVFRTCLIRARRSGVMGKIQALLMTAQRSGKGFGGGFPKICGAMDGGAEAPQGCAVRSGFWKASPKDLHAPQLKGCE